MNSNTTFAENKRARAEANKLIFYDNDFLQTKEPMSDNAIAPFDYKTGLVGNKAYNIKVYTTALERVKRDISVKDNQLIIKAKSGKELNMAEDFIIYIATSVIVPDADVYVCSLRNVSHLAIITYQQEK